MVARPCAAGSERRHALSQDDGRPIVMAPLRDRDRQGRRHSRAVDAEIYSRVWRAGLSTPQPALGSLFTSERIIQSPLEVAEAATGGRLLWTLLAPHVHCAARWKSSLHNAVTAEQLSAPCSISSVQLPTDTRTLTRSLLPRLVRGLRTDYRRAISTAC